MERIIVLDFGGQYNQLIARRVREAGVYAEILPYTASEERLRSQEELKGIILTGGPDSAYAEDAKRIPPYVFDLGVPVWGICYGMQALAVSAGGSVGTPAAGEFGRTAVQYAAHPLLEGIDIDDVVWMNHNDCVQEMPEGFVTIASSLLCPVAGFANDERRLYGVQFHPEVHHTPNGPRMFRNFLYNICGCKGGYSAENLAGSLIEKIRAQVGDAPVISALSGGVDSSVASVLVHKAIGSQLKCIFVDHGLLRMREAEEVMAFYKEIGMEVILVDASERFLGKLKGVTDPERKRKIIGEEFIRVFEEEARKLGGADYLVQGTIYPDVVESGTSSSATIKSHHNVGGLPERVDFKGLVEPLRSLFKDEVRALGESLGIPHKLVWRQPFPGPGLAVRIVGEITEERLRIVRHSDHIFRSEIAKAGLDEDIWQYFTVFTGVRSVGVMGDGRTYDNVIALRAVTSTDAMTVECAELPYPLLRRISGRIINEVPGVNRFVYDITSKPPGTIEWE